MTIWFGFDADAVIQDLEGDLVTAGVTYTAWTAETAGSQVTTLVDKTSVSLPGGVVPVESDGRLRFGDPTDTWYGLWLEEVGAGKPRWFLASTRGLAAFAQTGVPEGTVTSVASIDPDGTGNVPLTAADLGAITQADADDRYLQPIHTIPTPVQGIPITQMVWGGDASHGYGQVGATGTVTEDFTNYVLGDRSLLLTTDGAGGQTAAGDYVTGPIDATDEIPVLWLWIDVGDAAHISDFKFYVGSANFANIGYWNLFENAAAWPYIPEGQWTPISLPRGTFVTTGGTIDWSDLTSVQLAVFDDFTQAVHVRFGGFGLMPSPKVANPSGVISICHDDGHSTALTKMAPHLDKYGMRATLYAIGGILADPGSFPTYLTIAQMLVLQDLHGWAIGSHAYDVTLSNTGYTEYPSAQQLADMWAIRGYLHAQGFRHADHLALPLGKYDATVLDNANHVFRSVRHLTHPAWETIPPANPLKLRAVSPTSTTTLPQMQQWVDEAVAGGEWLVITFHAIVDSSPTGTDVLTSDFQSLVDYIAASGAAVRTVPEVIDAGARTTDLTTALAGYVRLTGENAFDLPNSGGEPWLRLRIPNDGTDSNGVPPWPNRIEVWYFDNSTSQYRLGWYINEKGLLRVRGTTPSDVLARVMGHPDQSGTVPLQEWTPDDNTVKLIQFLLSQAVFNVPIIVPYIVNPLGERFYWGTANPYEDPAYANYRPDLGSGWADYNDV